MRQIHRLINRYFCRSNEDPHLQPLSRGERGERNLRTRLMHLGILFGLIVFSNSSPAVADGLIQSLPEDGSWVKYAIDAGATDGSVTITGTYTISSVGRADVDGEPFRWIELEMKGKFKRRGREADVTELFKLLIPEKYLVKGENPRDHVVKAFQQSLPGGVKELDLKGGGAQQVQSLDEFLHAPLTNVEKLGEIEIESKQGKLACTVEKADDGPGFATETWLCDKVPFGVAGFKYEKRNRAMTFKLNDFGNDAKSKLPDSK